MFDQHKNCANQLEEKGDRSITKYMTKCWTLANEMIFVGKPIEYEELIFYILFGLDKEF